MFKKTPPPAIFCLFLPQHPLGIPSFLFLLQQFAGERRLCCRHFRTGKPHTNTISSPNNKPEYTHMTTLNQIGAGQKVLVNAVGGSGKLRQHFLDMGLIPGTVVQVVKFAPMGDPMILQLHGYLLSFCKADAAEIEVTYDVPVETHDDAPKGGRPHPGLGEEGERFHDAAEAKAVPKDEVLRFALVGNQNCGKTTLFNQLTGANQHVGNFPGVTVERKSGQIRGHADTEVVDLPGIYSLSPYTAEEGVSRQYVVDEHPHAIINIIDATNIERNLYLTMQLMELGVPMVLALNMMDELRGNGGTVLINEMEHLLGVPVVPIAAAKNEGVDELVEHAIHVARYQECPQQRDFCRHDDEHGGALHRCLHALMHLTEDRARAAGLPVRFAAGKLLEGDDDVLRRLHLDDDERGMMQHILHGLQKERQLDAPAALAEMRYAFIRDLCRKCVVKPRESREQRRSNAIDHILTGRWTALPAFCAIMAAVFWITFDSLGAWMQGGCEKAVESLTQWIDQGLTMMNISEVVHSLVVDGICAGVGAVVAFLPIIVLLFFFLSLLEDSGYMARIAFVMDRLLRRLGLSGRSIVPMLIGFGCSVPAVMATRTLPSERDRRLTILLTPFMSCTAKMPVYAFFCAAFFPANGGMVMLALYLTGIIVGIIVTFVYKSTLLRGEAVPFVMELPCYRLPRLRNVVMLMWEKARDFMERAFTVIFLASIVIWFLQHFDFHLLMVDDASESMLATIAGMLAPLFGPLGFADWRIVVALISGFMAKESIVGTLGILFPEGTLQAALTTAGVASLLVFCLLYTPCVAAVAAIRRELSKRWAWLVVVGQCLIAWICAYIAALVFQFL